MVRQMIRFFRALFNLIPFMYDFWGIVGAILAIICIVIVFAIIWLILYTIIFTVVSLTGHQLPKIKLSAKGRVGRFFIDTLNRITAFIATIPAKIKGLPGAVKKLPSTLRSIPGKIEKKKEEKANSQKEAEDYSYIKADVIDIEPEIPDLEDPEGAIKKRPKKKAAEPKNEPEPVKEVVAEPESVKELEPNVEVAEVKAEPVKEVVTEPEPAPAAEAAKETEPVVEASAEVTPDPEPNPEPNPEPITQISTADEHTFKYSYEVLNRCFGRDYKTYSRSALYLNEERTMLVWFPKIYTTVAAAEKAAATAKENVFAISKNGQNLHTVGDITDDGNGIRFVFAKIGRKPYRFLGVFTKDLAKSKKDVLYFKQIETEADLTRWNTED